MVRDIVCRRRRLQKFVCFNDSPSTFVLAYVTAQIKACKKCGTTSQDVNSDGFCASCPQVIMTESGGGGGGDGDGGDEHHEENVWFLDGPPLPTGVAGSESRKVYVDKYFAQNLKPHQKQGVVFIWNNCFSDCNYAHNCDATTIIPDIG